MNKPRSLTAIAGDMLQCALAWSPDARIMGNATARELAHLATTVIDNWQGACPMCGAQPGFNIDCMICEMWSELIQEDKCRT